MHDYQWVILLLIAATVLTCVKLAIFGSVFKYLFRPVERREP